MIALAHYANGKLQTNQYIPGVGRLWVQKHAINCTRKSASCTILKSIRILFIHYEYLSISVSFTKRGITTLQTFVYNNIYLFGCNKEEKIAVKHKNV